MRYQFLISILFQISYEFSYVRVDNFEISYSITYESSCHVEIDRFLFKLQSSIENCVKECSSRQHCQALNFRKGINVCELFSTSESGQLASGNCLHVEKDDINVIQTPCKNGCKYGEVCETTDSGIGTCVIKECVNVTVPDHGTILGNQREVGKKIRYKCDKGYKEKNVTSATVAECLSTGNWSANAECHKINYTWTTWMDWSSCSLSCDNGTRTRSRICSIASENLSEELCKEGNKSFEEESCNEHNCPCKK
ncbi:uncharacterized protein LOC123555402 [Mercenaria mercenaria]|uniref:uncharacterized protein LOC123555402 n=1 Tax=Mercenaria mercenaria TaxID=6596 RepID=UPI00234EE2E1|nr:uncharacterized protein LOC123555402 [Mercenaria mercenaria]